MQVEWKSPDAGKSTKPGICHVRDVAVWSASLSLCGVAVGLPLGGTPERGRTRAEKGLKSAAAAGSGPNPRTGKDGTGSVRD